MVAVAHAAGEVSRGFFAQTLAKSALDAGLRMASEAALPQDKFDLIVTESVMSGAVWNAPRPVPSIASAAAYPGRLQPCGCEYLDAAAEVSIECAQCLPQSDFANAQTPCEVQFNQLVFFAHLQPEGKFLGRVVAAADAAVTARAGELCLRFPIYS